MMLFLIVHRLFSSEFLEGMAPYVMSNTLIETSKDHLEKITYMEDTCGNYMQSDYNSYNHSTNSRLNTKPTSISSQQSCEIFQRFVSDTCGNSSCNTICTNPKQYYDITTDNCQYCPIGYGVENNRNNKCIPLETCPSGMKYVNNTGICLPCPSGKKYDDTTNCVNKCFDYQNLNADGTCSLTCPLRNQRWDPHTKHCVNCPAGYVADGHNNCVPAPTCSPGLILDSNNNCVAKCTMYWERYDKTTNSCVQICLANQQYKNGSCMDCPNGGRSDGNNGCLPGPTTPPMTCPTGYNLVNNKCESYCPIWEKNNLINTSICDPICYRNTQYFNTTTHSCLSCPQGQISDGKNGCIPAPTPAPTPLVCTPGYALNSSSTACNSICPPWRQNNLQNPSQCDLRCPISTHTYYDTTKFKCMDCPNGGTADNNNKCIAPTTTPPPTTSIVSNHMTITDIRLGSDPNQKSVLVSYSYVGNYDWLVIRIYSSTQDSGLMYFYPSSNPSPMKWLNIAPSNDIPPGKYTIEYYGILNDGTPNGSPEPKLTYPYTFIVENTYPSTVTISPPTSLLVIDRVTNNGGNYYTVYYTLSATNAYYISFALYGNGGPDDRYEIASIGGTGNILPTGSGNFSFNFPAQVTNHVISYNALNIVGVNIENAGGHYTFK